MEAVSLKKTLDDLYTRFNTPSAIHPDPLEFVYKYSHARDREMVGLIASSLAYGRVRSILRSVSHVLTPMGNSPTRFIITHTHDDFKKTYGEFVHRFTKGTEIALFLEAVRRVLAAYGNLQACFLSHDHPGEPTVVPALRGFIHEFYSAVGTPFRSLLPDPDKGSAMKRLHLFLRWMVRKDKVDPGVWGGISPAKLLYPLDTHIHAVGLRLGLTRRKSADLKTAREITEGFRVFAPRDPVRYDFGLTRMEILKVDDLDPES